MPNVQLRDIRLHYTVAGPARAPALILSNSLGTNEALWAQQMPALTQHFRVVRYDTRGHGLTDHGGQAFNFHDLAADVVQLMDHLSLDAAHFCGISMGGMIGMALALNHSARLNRLVLCNTAARIGTAEGWRSRADMVEKEGLERMAPTLIERWLSDTYRSREPGMTQILVDMLGRTDNAGYIACCEALAEADLQNSVCQIKAPTLVLTGALDLAATPEQGRILASAIPGAQLQEMNTSHISNWEQPKAFTEVVTGFLLGR